MKKNKKGSILIWSIFLVVFLSFSFIYISTKIQHQIQNTMESNLFASEQNVLKKETLGGDGTIFLFTSEEKKIFFPHSQSGLIMVLSGGPIEYSIFSGSIALANGYVFDKSTILDFQADVYVKNLGGPTKIKLNAESFSGVIFPEIYEKKSLNIGTQEITHEMIKK